MFRIMSLVVDRTVWLSLRDTAKEINSEASERSFHLSGSWSFKKLVIRYIAEASFSGLLSVISDMLLYYVFYNPRLAVGQVSFKLSMFCLFMARNRTKKLRDWGESGLSIFKLTSKETANGILGVFSIVLSIFFLLGAVGFAGQAGTLVYNWLSYLFGFGYYLLPVVFLLLAASFLREQERDFAMPQIFGSLVLFLSSLGLVDILSNDGGVAGRFLSRSLSSLFDIYLSAVILAALVVTSILVIFNTSIKFDVIAFVKKFFSRKEIVPLAPTENAAINKAVETASFAGKGQTLNTDSQGLTLKSEGKMKHDEGFAPTLMRRSGKKWPPPPLSLLEGDRGKPGVGDIKANANLIKRTLMNFGIVVEMDEISIGPSVTRYALKPAEGVKLSRILALQNNLELALAAHPVRIEAPIPGKSLVGIEVPNTLKSIIGLGSLISDEQYSRSSLPLLVSLGRDISGHSHFANLARMPHLLLAGATGAGKSVTIHTIVTSLLFRNPPENLKFIMIDPKRVELTMYNKIPHLLTPVITDPKKAILALKWLAKEMERRYDILEKSSVRDITSYHQNILAPAVATWKLQGGRTSRSDLPETMPYIAIIIDELADIMSTYPRELESAIVRLAQMSRAIGIHLIISTQRPSVNVITGLIKANIPTRIALQVASQIDSRTILDQQGAEKLLGAGDMLYLGCEMSKPIRLQSAYITESEIKKVVKFIIDQYKDEINDEINLSSTEHGAGAAFDVMMDDNSLEEEDELYETAREEVTSSGKASTSYLQRKLGVGYSRAAKLMDMLEEHGIIGPANGSKPRDVIGVGAGMEREVPDDTPPSEDNLSADSTKEQSNN